ncbi:MAG: CusA/CzcA family heavy metal efflux RND transporter [Bacteroidetes bacterium]|nr:CusA/CzcA family heavy metal efflux RND transporter [Bacteroidota bacterium]
MIDKLISFSIRNKIIIGLFTFALIAWGTYSLKQLPIDAVPDITNNQVQVITVASTLSAQEVEQFITSPIEYNLTTIPDVIELRSISRFGLSVITVVFKDEVDIYKGRQMVSERLKEAETQIPEGFGKPELAPVTTGLGEIYQYVLHPKKGYEKKYSAMDLRTIQDWIVRRQLLGTVGVADVSSFGGYLKQYEVAVNPDKLRSMNVSLAEIFSALEKNNQNTGGAYIEKKPNAYFIRGIGLVTSLDDIKKIVIRTNQAGIPLIIDNVATVKYGSAVRYGAMTRNDEGEVVGALVLMLKGANSAQVIEDVKKRIAQIEKSLPEGVAIEPFLDRTKLVNNAIGTVEKNLLEGGLIVVFILVLLLGNFRAGLVVASVIPLAMLFAIAMMNLFGVSGNLMSLGAIDFGLIVDGAVIIVEAVVHRITMSKHHHTGIAKLSSAQMDSEVYESAKRMMNSASFGQIIILIVYFPILALIGVEGKMFRPMAQTVSFAIIGALILSLTYVPMMSALFLSKKTEHKRNISDRIMDFFQRMYKPLLEFSLKRKILVTSISILLFVASVFVFTRMGGEFIPTLEEGDFAVETTLMQGTSLSQTIETFQQGAKIIKDKFPEVIEVIGKIGSAEIPTDPMPINNGDMMIILKDKSEWTSASNREELAEKMSEALSVIPGVEFGFQQPIQMRFNELMTGARQDVAIKIFGEDLNLLADNADKISKLIQNIDGVEDIYVEKVTGLPQVQVKYDRDKIAQYGLTISDVNRVLSTAFAGEVAGVVFEGEKRFDMVVRLDSNFRTKIDDVKDLYVPLPSGNQVPIEQVADVQFKLGPVQVSREDAKRRIYVGFNVRGRDVQSVVEEIQKKFDSKLKLPAGYFISYGGTFQNLIEAKKRLSIALPVALLLIFILLFFTFKSLKQGVLIYTAIPLSAIGGVFALWLRDMPFSISAGVGFIALFGVAVLNGIVLIAEFNRLKEEGEEDIYERVRKGTRIRLRPVIMTASVASLGFLPMAISSSAGAEVQKPLATVVIGGLITATLLTLVVLPVLYILFSGKKKIKPMNTTATIIILLFASSLIPQEIFAQENKPLTIDDCIKTALQNNPQIKSATLEVEQQNVLKKTAFDLPKTNVSVLNGQYNSEVKDTYIGVTQDIYFPTVYIQQNKMQKQNVLLSEKNLAVTQAELIRNVKSAYYQLSFGMEKLKLLSYQDSIYKKFSDVAELKYKTGETSYLEKLSAQSKYQEIQVYKKQAEADIIIYQQELQKLLNVQNEISIADNKLQKQTLSVNSDTTAIKQNPLLAYYNQKILLAGSQLSLEKNKFLPDFSVGYFNQSLDNIKGFQGVQFGIGIPIFFWGQQGRVQSAKIQTQIAQSDYELAQNNLKTIFNQQLQEYQKYSDLLNYYESTGVKQADEILKASQLAYTKGEIGYVEYIQNLTQAISIKSEYLNSLNQFNQTVININYLTGK